MRQTMRTTYLAILLFGVPPLLLAQPTAKPPALKKVAVAETLSHAAFSAVDSLSLSCSGVNLSTSHQHKPSGHGTPSRW